MGAPPSVWDRAWQVMSLAQLGRFSEAAEYEAEAIRLGEPTHHASTVSLAYFAAGTLHLVKGDWAKARLVVERWLAAVRTGNVVLQLPWAVASSAWALAQLGEASEALERLREGEQHLDRLAERGIVGNRSWGYQSLGRAALLLGQPNEAQSLGDRAIESAPSHRGFAAHAMHLLGDITTHPDRFDAESGETHYRQALALAEPRGMRPLVAHCHLGLGKLYHRTGKSNESEEHLTTARAMYREMG
jgi:tetratricopeptide (TPR) repeat protein